MKFCQHCGKQLMDEAIICPGCGCSVQTTNNNQVATVDESVSIGLVIGAILFPIFGIIYWAAKAKTRPKCAKICGGAALISWGVCFFILMGL